MTTTGLSGANTREAFEREIPPFQIEKFLALSKQLDLSGISLEDASKYPLSAGEIRVLQYMQDTEFFTVHYAKAILSSAAIADEDTRAFVVVWAYEECSHGRALASFLKHAGHEPSRRSIEEFARPRGWLEVVQDLFGRVVASTSNDFLAVQAVWGAINELTAVHAYSSLADRTKNPVLAQILRRITKDERRHYAFYTQQAQRRLVKPFAQKLSKFMLESLWTPVGGSMASAGTIDYVGAYLFDDAEGQARLDEIDDTIAKLPGMGWFNLVKKATNAGIDRMHAKGTRVERP